ncbi:jg14188 [Pararge aegeria aegeria]|uniref:Jg14188 protein n=1 Tax=Pararge aegeria aegeria TaxID=348720 RepID=A0A8S4S8L6_9NEOP|nr:jg14188 [Pararge aegeria aegeria]
MAASVSTPINTVSRDNLVVLIRNNVLNSTVELSDNDGLETDSPVRKRTNLQPIIKKLFHSPHSPHSPILTKSRANNCEKENNREV